ncbi:MAG: hypothetical protein M1835_004031, partial [Candelina submexicana]
QSSTPNITFSNMKSSIYALIATLALTQVTASAIPTSSSDFHIIQDSPLGPIYSNAAPKSRRSDSKTYLVGGDANHPVYSNIDPAERAKVESSQAETSKRTAESQPELVEKREVTEASIDEWVGKHPDSGYSAEKMKEYLRTHPDAMAESSHELPPKDLVVAPEQESGGLIEKRDWELCVGFI